MTFVPTALVVVMLVIAASAYIVDRRDRRDFPTVPPPSGRPDPSARRGPAAVWHLEGRGTPRLPGRSSTRSGADVGAASHAPVAPPHPRAVRVGDARLVAVHYGWRDAR